MPSVAYLFVSAVEPVSKPLRIACKCMQLVYDRISTLAKTSTPSLMRLYHQAKLLSRFQGFEVASTDAGPIENEAPLSFRACGTWTSVAGE